MLPDLDLIRTCARFSYLSFAWIRSMSPLSMAPSAQHGFKRELNTSKA
jgi:hypothetical protein